LDAVQGARPKAYREYGKGEQRRNAPNIAPSLWVAAKKRGCIVARLANIPDIGCASRLASIASWPSNVYVKADQTGS
jgi:hypothetical protein